MTANLTNAACQGLYWLFDSTAEADHRQARAICQTCPAILACQALLEEELTVGRTRGPGAAPRGTWAGRLIGKPKRCPR